MSTLQKNYLKCRKYWKKGLTLLLKLCAHFPQIGGGGVCNLKIISMYSCVIDTAVGEEYRL